MFVSLIAPWSPIDRYIFLLQGIMIESVDEISQIQQTWEYVYIDSEKSDESIAANLKSISSQTSTIANYSTGSIEHESAQADLEQYTFKKELNIARKLLERTRSYVDWALGDVRLAQAVDTEGAKDSVMNKNIM